MSSAIPISEFCQTTKTNSLYKYPTRALSHITVYPLILVNILRKRNIYSFRLFQYEKIDKKENGRKLSK